MHIPVILRPVKCLRPSEAEILDVCSGYSKRQHPSFVPQGQISQKPLRKVVPLIMHIQFEPASGVLFAPSSNKQKYFFLEYLEK